MKPVVVVDASVTVKWFVPTTPAEEDTETALSLLRAYRDDQIELHQPPIWCVEVLAVLARIVPELVEQHTRTLLAFDHEEATGSAFYLKAVQLAVQRPDNNLTENAIRPFVVGRKNWLFSATPEGAAASATLYSIIETAKANGLNPYWYLRRLFERLPLAKTAEDFKALLPQYIDRALLAPA